MEASKPEDIGRAGHFITLVQPGPQGPIVLCIRPLRRSELIAVMGGIAGLPRGIPAGLPAEQMTAVIRALTEQSETLERAVRASAVRPQFWFESDEEKDRAGKAEWDQLSIVNQLDYYEQLMRLSSAPDFKSPEGQAAVAAAEFPANETGA